MVAAGVDAAHLRGQIQPRQRPNARHQGPCRHPAVGLAAGVQGIHEGDKVSVDDADGVEAVVLVGAPGSAARGQRAKRGIHRFRVVPMARPGAAEDVAVCVVVGGSVEAPAGRGCWGSARARARDWRQCTELPCALVGRVVAVGAETVAHAGQVFRETAARNGPRLASMRVLCVCRPKYRQVRDGEHGVLLTCQLAKRVSACCSRS